MLISDQAPWQCTKFGSTKLRAGLRHVRAFRPNRAADFRGPPFWTLTREPEMLQNADAFCEHIMQQNLTAAEAPSRTPLTPSTAPPDNLVGFEGSASRRGRRGKEGKQKGREGWKRREGRLTLIQWRI